MAYYDTYRSVPGWGTSSYRFATPLQPTYQPQPFWRGGDYYRAHGGYQDQYAHLSLLYARIPVAKNLALIRDAYNYAWSRVRDRAAVGFGKDEARLWHRRVYGGLVSLFLHLRALEEE